MFRRRILLKTAIRNRAINQENRTRAANAALPKLRNSDLGPGPSLAGASIHSELIEFLTNYGGAMPNESLKKLYLDELKALFSAENQLVKALPKMAKAASSNELRAGFEKHLEQTKGHVQRLEEIFRSLDESRKARSAWA